MASKKVIEAAREDAAAPTYARMDADIARMSHKPQELNQHFRDHLFESGLTMTTAKKAIRSGDNSLATRFRNYHGKKPMRYVRYARLEVADRMLRNYGFTVAEVAEAVGYDNLRRFCEHFEEYLGDDPEDVRGQNAVPEVDVATYRQAVRGELPDRKRRKVEAWFRRHNPDTSDPRPPLTDGPGRERQRAEELWEDVRDLAPEEQRRHLLYFMWTTTALFDLLRRKAREEGRKDRRLGIRLARLALESLGRCADWCSDRVHDLRALGLAELAHALRLARDFVAAEAKFQESWAEWRTPRKDPDPLVEAEICLLHGTLRMFQRRYKEALQLINRALSLFEAKGDDRGRAEALIQRAAIRGYMGQLQRSIDDLRRASGLWDPETELQHACGVCISLANAMARRGDYESSLRQTAKARQLLSPVDCPLRLSEIEWVEGFVKHETGDLLGAEELYLSANSRLAGTEELLPVTLLSLDIDILYCQQKRYDEAIDLASELLPGLQSLRLHPETLEAIALLAKAVGTREVSRSLLRKVREAIRQDPLSTLA